MAALTPRRCDVAVIGAGTAGLAAERIARKRGARTLLIDDVFSGTTCASVGCMPSKLLIAAADSAHSVKRSDIFGVKLAGFAIDGAAVMRRVRRERDAFVAKAKTSYDDVPHESRIKARAKFLSPNELELSDGSRVHAKAVVVATGAETAIPEAFDAVRSRILTNKTIFEIDELPSSIAVIGAGALGLELAQALSRLGVRTRVFEKSARLGGIRDPQVARKFAAAFAAETPIELSVEVAVRLGTSGISLRWSGASNGEETFQHLLLAAGRPPQLGDLALGNAGIELDEHGVPEFDKHTMQCGTSSIFIAGDADADRPVLHEASAEGTIAGLNAAQFPTVLPCPRYAALSIMFTDPPVAQIGAIPDFDSDGNLKSHGSSGSAIVAGPASYENQGRAVVFARNAGLSRLYADRSGGRLTGATLAGPGVEQSAHLIAWAVQRQLTATEVLDLPFYHPTFEEGLKPALEAICAEIQSPVPLSRAGAAPPGA